MADAKKTVLFDRHVELAGKSRVVDFAGWMMPLWYSSITAEHRAVREAAGLFDCAHMAVLKVFGADAAKFLNVVSTNDTSMLSRGKAQYSYLFHPDGGVIDDIIVYCNSDDNFMVVANASNEQKVKDWLKKVSSEKIQIDSEWDFQIADLKDSSLPDARVDLALQGPAAGKCLESIFGKNFENLKPLKFTTVKEPFDVIISATGYTGAKTSFELFIHPDKAVALWDMILEKGRAFGALPCGLGARDSLRIEAGLPLYGHELAGDFQINPFQAGYGWAVKFDKDNFLGKDKLSQQADNVTEQVSRLKFDGSKGVRPVRQFDAILDGEGVCIGSVLSSARAGEEQIVLALIKKDCSEPGKKVGVYYLARNAGHIKQGRKEKVAVGEKLPADIKGAVAQRFEKF